MFDNVPQHPPDRLESLSAGAVRLGFLMKRTTALTRHEIGRVARFIGANGVGTALDVSMVTLLHRELGVILVFAISCGFLSSMLCGFVLNRRFVFGDGRASLAAASWRYSALVLFNFGVGVGVVTLLVSHGWNYLLTRVLSSTFLVVCNFSLARWWVFAVPGDNAVAETQAATH